MNAICETTNAVSKRSRGKICIPEQLCEVDCEEEATGLFNACESSW